MFGHDGDKKYTDADATPSIQTTWDQIYEMFVFWQNCELLFELHTEEVYYNNLHSYFIGNSKSMRISTKINAEQIYIQNQIIHAIQEMN